MGRIETGVDKLVRLVHDRKKISIDEAAKDLGVSKLVITEWAEFLMEEELITVDYSLSKTYLKERELTKKEIATKSKEYENKKEAFVRRIDTAITQMDRGDEGLSRIREEFEGLRKSLGKEVEEVRGELKELEKYEKLKATLDKDIEQELGKYQEQVKQASLALKQEQKRYESLLGSIEEEEERIGKDKDHLKSLEALEDDFEKRADKIENLLSRARKELSDERKEVAIEEKHLDALKSQSDKLKKELSSTKKDKIDTLEDSRQEHEKAIVEMRKRISERAAKARETVTDDVAQGRKAAKDFEQFFKRKLDVDKQLLALDKDKQDLQKELEQLRKVAVSFDLSTKKDVKSHVKDLEKRFSEWEKKRKKHEGALRKLVQGIFK